MEKSDVYVITGGGGGIGVACARRLGKKGTLILNDIDSDRVNKVAAQLRSEGFRIETIVQDISKDSAEILAKTVAPIGRFAGAVNTAGLSPRMGEWQRIFEVNLIGTAHLLNTLLPLAERGTAVVCLASNSAYMMPPNEEIDALLDQPLDPDFYKKIEKFIPEDPATTLEKSGIAYALSKRGVIRLCARKASEWGEYGARLNSVSPGLTDTPMLRGDAIAHPEMIKDFIEMSSEHRTGRPEEIANAIYFLMSEEASFINGSELLVDGGLIANQRRNGLIST